MKKTKGGRLLRKITIHDEEKFNIPVKVGERLVTLIIDWNKMDGKALSQ
jgi:hypothetical protein